MNTNTGFFASLNKSTKITLFSCLGFVLLTCLILFIFVLFPITPSEKIMASIGRENVLNGGKSGDPSSVMVGVITTSPEDAVPVTEKKDEVRVTTTARTVNIRITSGSGFLWGGRIPTGFGGASYPTTATEDPDTPTVDPGVEPVTPTPTEPGGNTDNPDNPDPPVDTPTPTEPGKPNEKPDPTPVDPDPVTPDPPTPPVVDPDPVTPDPPAPPEGGDTGGGGGEPSPDPAV